MKVFLVQTLETVTNTYKVYGNDDDTLETIEKKFFDHEFLGAAVFEHDPVLIDTEVENCELDEVRLQEEPSKSVTTNVKLEVRTEK